MKAIKAALLFSLLPLSLAAQARNEPAAAGDSLRISLDDAVAMSLKASKQLRVSYARQMQAQASLREAHERRLPDFTITASYLRLANPDIDLKLKLNKDDNGSTGGSTEQASATPVVKEAAYAMANASLPLFTGFKIQNGIESAKYLAKAATLDAGKDRADIALNTVAAYVNLYKAAAAEQLVQENLSSARQRVRDLSNLEKNGLLARNDLLKAELQASHVELTLLEAQNNLRVATVNMDLMLGLPEGTILITDSNFSHNATMHPLTEWENLALENRRDAAALGYRAKAAEAGVRAARGDYYPSLALTAGYIGAHIPNVVTIKDAVNAGVGLSYSPSSLWKSGTKVAEAKARLAEAEAGQALLEDGIRLQVTQAYEAWLLSRKKIEVYQSAVEQAEENYRIVRNKNLNALATTTELLDADVAQLQAKLNYAFAKADAAAAYKNLLHAAGLLDTGEANPIK